MLSCTTTCSCSRCAAFPHAQQSSLRREGRGACGRRQAAAALRSGHPPVRVRQKNKTHTHTHTHTHTLTHTLKGNRTATPARQQRQTLSPKCSSSSVVDGVQKGSMGTGAQWLNTSCGMASPLVFLRSSSANPKLSVTGTSAVTRKLSVPSCAAMSERKIDRHSKFVCARAGCVCVCVCVCPSGQQEQVRDPHMWRQVSHTSASSAHPHLFAEHLAVAAVQHSVDLDDSQLRENAKP